MPATVTCGVLALYFLVEAFEPFSVFRLALGLATAALTFRLALRTKLSADQDGVVWHTLTRTRHWPYRAIDHFEVASRVDGPSESSKQVLRIHLADGHAQWLGGSRTATDLRSSDSSDQANLRPSSNWQTI